ncbi:hypothetical protein L227DRAFT_617763 [Lentinus tigrinus ALCF2SS1-6]|uniref:Uncharacterized protein n=1 Tax=Lentinus tigrinus ALCF2SS1-6 TaxID=1328759 RepID=A0A5C2RMG3_9APHY|nr:hypothetical protein L227DRAFT_617763 [Lentinus tigrinus ALCF2SS1-6]
MPPTSSEILPEQLSTCPNEQVFQGQRFQWTIRRPVDGASYVQFQYSVPPIPALPSLEMPVETEPMSATSDVTVPSIQSSSQGSAPIQQQFVKPDGQHSDARSSMSVADNRERSSGPVRSKKHAQSSTTGMKTEYLFITPNRVTRWVRKPKKPVPRSMLHSWRLDHTVS